VNADDLFRLAIPVGIMALAVMSRLARGKRRDRPDSTAAGAPGPSAPSPAAPSLPASATVPQQRVAAIVGELRRRGITPPPALQAMAAREGVTLAPPPRPPIAPQPQPQPQPQQRAVSPAPPAIPAAPVFDIQNLGIAARPAIAPAGSAGRMLIEAFSDPAHARNAVILAEVLRPPVALR
jgi:hypothetical protein